MKCEDDNVGAHWPTLTSLTWNLYLGQDDLTRPGSGLTVELAGWGWWSYMLIVKLVSVIWLPTACWLAMLMSWTNHPVVLWVMWGEREGERDEWCWWNCKYQPRALRPFQHPQVSFTVTKRASNGPVQTWLPRWYPSYLPSLLIAPHELQENPGRPIIFTRNLLDCGKSLQTYLPLSFLW